jgi:hypothetical protein
MKRKAIFDRGSEVLQNYFDIEYIFEKLIEVEKLKTLLLDKHQRVIFENTPRPEILVEQDNFELRYHYLPDKNRRYVLDDVITSYENVSQDAIECQGTSLRLLEMLDPQFVRTMSKHSKVALPEQLFSQKTKFSNKSMGTIHPPPEASKSQEEEIHVIGPDSS